MKRLIWFGGGAAALLALWLYGATRPVRVDMATIGRGPIREFVEEEGQTRVVDRYVVSVPVAGRLERLTLEEGDPVKRGDVVAEIDPLQLKSRVGEAEANVRALRHQMAGVATKRPKEAELERARVLEAKARDDLDVARRELEAARAEQVRAEKDLSRAKEGIEAGTDSAETLDVATADAVRAREEVRAGEVRLKIRDLEIKAAHLNTVILESRLRDFDWEEKNYEAQIAALESGLLALRDDLQRTQIVAPADGIVLTLDRESEAFVPAGTRLMEIGDLATMEVEADFLSEDAAHMKVGMVAEIFGRALGDREIPGTIRRIHPSAFRKISSLGVEQQRVIVVVGFERGRVPLGDRFRVEVRVILDERADVALVPEGALFREGGTWHAFAVEGGRAALRRVETGLRDGRRREVRAGLKAGDRVILHPDDRVEEGVRVKALEEK